MAELYVIGALRNKRAELAGMLNQLEQQLVQQRANLAHSVWGCSGGGMIAIRSPQINRSP
jgi:hypothetical protein